MMDTTPTLEMLTTPGSPENQRAINKQIKVVKLVMEHTKGVVLGGCPRDHFDNVAAADIDIYVQTPAEVQALKHVLQIEDLRSVFNNTTPVPTNQSERETHYRACVYLTDIYEGTARVRGDTTKVNIMLAAPSVCPLHEPRSTFALVILQHFEHPLSHYMYCMLQGELKLVQMYRSVVSGVVSHNEDYNRKILRKMLIRNSQLGMMLLNPPSLMNSRGVFTSYQTTQGYITAKATEVCISQNTRRIKKNGALSKIAKSEPLYPWYFQLNKVQDSWLFRMYEEGEISYSEYLDADRELQARRVTAEALQRRTVETAEERLRSLRHAFDHGTGSAGSLPPHWDDPGSIAPSMQSSGGEAQELAQEIRVVNTRTVSGVSNLSGTVRNEPTAERSAPVTRFF
jgi:hypothetical protein